MTLKKDQYLTKVWQDILSYLISNNTLTEGVIDQFYSSVYISNLNENKAILIAPDFVSKNILNADLKSFEEAFKAVLNIDGDFSCDVYDSTNIPAEKPQQISLDTSLNKNDSFLSMDIQSDRTFETFIVGDCNREAHAASYACAVRPGKLFNPLFIYGNSGLGKTHLLMAIANQILKEDPTKKVYYTGSMKFVETVVNCIRDNKIDEFKQFMYNLDVLLIDDIQMIADKQKSHEVFFSIYNELANKHKQICITSDCQPKELKGLQERLISRFSSGLTVGIDSPEFETSLAILQSKIKQNGYGIEDVEEEGLNYIASNFSGSVRELEGAWNRVLFCAIQFQPGGGIIKFETIMNALKSQAVVSEKTGLSPKKIIKIVADYYGLTRQQITSKTRTKNIANARHIAIYLCRKLLDIPYTKIGDEFGGRDHSTIMSACTKVEEQIKKDQLFANALRDIENKINQ